MVVYMSKSELKRLVYQSPFARQDAERIAELEANNLAMCKRLSETQVERDELCAKLDALEKQEPKYFVLDEKHRGLSVSEGYYMACLNESMKMKLYAKPVPATPAIPEGCVAIPSFMQMKSV